LKLEHLPVGLVAGRVVYVIEEQPNPSTDCFVVPAIAAGGGRVVRSGFRDLPATGELEGAVVVFVRYVPGGWAKLVQAARAQLGGLVFFMDDDVLDVRASTGTPWRYRLKLARLAAARFSWLRRQRAQFWVSTPHLLKKYARWDPRLVRPSPIAGAAEPVRVFYHATASHDAEKRWLRPVVEEVLRRDPRVFFEIVGGHAVERLYRGLVRVQVVHQMKWPAYQAFLDGQERHVGFAPQLNTPFNQARSYTKFFDITRCRAAGIYSSESACAEIVSHGVDGLIVDLKEDAWVKAVLGLTYDEPLRQRLVRNAEAKMAALTDTAHRSYAEALAHRPDGIAGFS
jgi:hypothetical protein